MKVTIHKMRVVTAPGYPPCFEFYVYFGTQLARVCPSEAMAREIAGKDLAP